MSRRLSDLNYAFHSSARPTRCLLSVTTAFATLIGCNVDSDNAIITASGTTGFTGTSDVTGTDIDTDTDTATSETSDTDTDTDSATTMVTVTSGDGDGDGDGDDGPGECGNSIVEGLETCDCGDDGDCTPEELDNMGCEDLTDPLSGNVYDGGVLTCNMSCQFVMVGCFVCGDGNLIESETCDGNQFGTNTCGSEGFLGGDLICTDTCELDTSNCTEATWNEDWESGEIDNGLWGSGGDAPWVIDMTEASGGVMSAHSGAIGDNAMSELILDMTWDAAGTIAFAHKQDTEWTIDKLQFFIDGVQQGEDWGEQTDWLDESYPVTAGTHRLMWRYSKDGSIATGLDRVWVDDIRSDGYPAVATCGDNFLSSGEICDGNDLGANSCASEGFLGGTLSCDGSCELVTTGCTVATWTEDWESGSVDDLTWLASGDANWVIDSTVANGGSFSAHSGAIGGSQMSELILDMTWAAAGTIAFFHRTDCDQFGDQLQFFIDDVQQGINWSGTNTPWTDDSYAVSAGTHRLKWRYSKDASFESGLDRAWLDDVRSDGTVAVPTCGDNFLSSGETCDGTELGGNTCEDQGFLGGVMACDGSCDLDTSGCVSAAFTEDWETGDFTNATWVAGGDADWIIDATEAQTGTYSVRSGVIGSSSTSDMSITLTFASAGVMNFARRLNSAISDELIFLIDDVEQNSWYGVEDWTTESFPVTMGTHTFTWRYSKNAAGSTTQDRVWVDNIISDGTP